MSFMLSLLPYPLTWTDLEISPTEADLAFRMTDSGDSDQVEQRNSKNSALIRRMAGGDRDALAELYDSLSRPLYATAKYILNDASEAQDVVHDVFLALWNKAA